MKKYFCLVVSVFVNISASAKDPCEQQRQTVNTLKSIKSDIFEDIRLAKLDIGDAKRRVKQGHMGANVQVERAGSRYISVMEDGKKAEKDLGEITKILNSCEDRFSQSRLAEGENPVY